MLQVKYFTTAGKGWPVSGDDLGINATQFLYDNTTSINDFPKEFDSVQVFVNDVEQPTETAQVDGDVLRIMNGGSLPRSTPIVVSFNVKEE
jgi:hypothetical protein